MRTTRIEIEGDGGRVTIERTGSATVRVEVTNLIPKRNEHMTRDWTLPVEIDADALFEVATQVQRIVDGHGGTNSMIHDYYRELQRFTG